MHDAASLSVLCVCRYHIATGPDEMRNPGVGPTRSMAACIAYYLLVHIYAVLSPAQGRTLIILSLVRPHLAPRTLLPPAAPQRRHRLQHVELCLCAAWATADGQAQHTPVGLCVRRGPVGVVVWLQGCLCACADRSVQHNSTGALPARRVLRCTLPLSAAGGIQQPCCSLCPRCGSSGCQPVPTRPLRRCAARTVALCCVSSD